MCSELGDEMIPLRSFALLRKGEIRVLKKVEFRENSLGYTRFAHP
jgi:hypothetical protein